VVAVVVAISASPQIVKSLQLN